MKYVKLAVMAVLAFAGLTMGFDAMAIDTTAVGTAVTAAEADGLTVGEMVIGAVAGLVVIGIVIGVIRRLR